MKRGRKPQTEHQTRPTCVCGNLCEIAPKSKLGFIRFAKACSTCLKKLYGQERKPYRKKKKPHCESCGFVAKHKCQLDIHHIDGNHDNNTENNLQTLCANCHRLVHFGGP
jgi:hypothetical protein